MMENRNDSIDIFLKKLVEHVNSFTCNFNNLDEINKLLDILLLEIESFEYSPKFILTRAMYCDDNTSDFMMGKFVIRPTIKYQLNTKNMKQSFVIINDGNFFVSFVLSILNWVKDYNNYLMLNSNLDLLNTKINEIIVNNSFPYNITFTLGEGIVDINDNSIVLGLSEICIENIPNLNLFSEDMYWKEKYIDKFLTVLKECIRPYDIVKIKSEITQELGIYNRKCIHKLLRKIVNRKIDFVRVGVGYIEDDNSFALVEKLAISDKDLKKYDLSQIIVEDNLNATLLERKKGLNKIITYYKLMPFEKKTNVFIDISLKEYMKNLNIKVV